MTQTWWWHRGLSWECWLLMMRDNCWMTSEIPSRHIPGWSPSPLRTQDRSPHVSDISSVTTHHRPHRPVPGLSRCLIPAFIQPLHCSVLSAVIILDIIHYPASNNTQTGQIFTGRVSVMALISDASNTPLSRFMGTISASLNCWWQKVTLHSW